MRKIILTAFVIFSISTAKSQDTLKTSDVLSKMAWLEGRWTGDGFGGESEEIWSPAADGTMMGMYRHIKDGKVKFYEFIHLNEKGMKLKHFTPDLVAWEDKEGHIMFSMIEVTDNKIILKGLTIERKSADTMEMHLQMKYGDELKTEVFHFNRQVR